jgi:hypothetical protein
METYIRQSRTRQQLLELILDNAAPFQGLASLGSEYKAVLFPQATDGVQKVPEVRLRGFWHFWHLITLGTLKKIQTKHARSVNFCRGSSLYFAIVKAQWKLRFIAAVKRRPARRGAAFLL